jgi:hypothetical protein
MAFLDEIGHREAVMAEAGCDRDHEPHVSRREAVQGVLVAVFFPADRQKALFLTVEERSVHGGSHKPATHPRDFSHRVLPGAHEPTYEGRESSDHDGQVFKK